MELIFSQNIYQESGKYFTLELKQIKFDISGFLPFVISISSFVEIVMKMESLLSILFSLKTPLGDCTATHLGSKVTSLSFPLYKLFH